MSIDLLPIIVVHTNTCFNQENEEELATSVVTSEAASGVSYTVSEYVSSSSTITDMTRSPRSDMMHSDTSTNQDVTKATSSNAVFQHVPLTSNDSRILKVLAF